jgi:hypothetical protein
MDSYFHTHMHDFTFLSSVLHDGVCVMCVWISVCGKHRLEKVCVDKCMNKYQARASFCGYIHVSIHIDLEQVCVDAYMYNHQAGAILCGCAHT